MLPGERPSRTVWQRLKRGEKCVVCGHVGHCTIAENRSVAKCMRLASKQPVTTGDKLGWIHRLAPDQVATVKTFTPAKAPVRSADEWAKLDSTFQRNAQARDVVRLETGLGVSLDALARLCVGWVSARELEQLDTRCKSTGAWTFPMREPGGKIVGIRLRTPDAFKYAVNGSHAGLFIPRHVQLRETVALCEGPTTCAALLTLGFNAIGRPSCTGGNEYVLSLLRKFKPSLTVVFGENDDAKPLPGGKVFYPGQDGARELLKRVQSARFPACMVLPVAGKDARDWLKAGATKAVVEYEIQDALRMKVSA